MNFFYIVNKAMHLKCLYSLMFSSNSNLCFDSFLTQKYTTSLFFFVNYRMLIMHHYSKSLGVLDACTLLNIWHITTCLVFLFLRFHCTFFFSHTCSTEKTQSIKSEPCRNFSCIIAVLCRIFTYIYNKQDNTYIYNIYNKHNKQKILTSEINNKTY